MNLGMLWFDGSKDKSVTDKAVDGAQFYALKYNRIPNLCFVNPKMMPTDADGKPMQSFRRGDLEIRSNRSVQPNYFWLGTCDKKG